MIARAMYLYLSIIGLFLITLSGCKFDWDSEERVCIDGVSYIRSYVYGGSTLTAQIDRNGRPVFCSALKIPKIEAGVK